MVHSVMLSVSTCSILLLSAIIHTSSSEQSPKCSAKDSGTNLTSWKGTIQSPGYGHSWLYPPGENCDWTIVIPKTLLRSTRVTLQLDFQQFDVGQNENNCSENGDHLQIMGFRPGKIQVLCKTDNKLSYTFENISSAFTQKLQLKFVSDEKQLPGERGFSVTYSFPKHPCAKCTDEQTCDESKPPDQIECTDPCHNYQCNHGKCVFNVTNRLPYCKCEKCWYSERCLSSYSCNGGECLDNSENFNKVKCNCTEGIKEAVCNNDPCQPNPCENDGKCSRANTPLHYKCTCLPNYMGTRCGKINHCASAPCVNGGVCSNIPDDFRCACPTNFTGKTCNQPNESDAKLMTSGPTRLSTTMPISQYWRSINFTLLTLFIHFSNGMYPFLDGTYCLEERDEYNGSHIYWNWVKMGDKDIQPCPYAEGQAIRRCSEMNDVNGSYAYWEVPDLSQCISPEFRKISSNAKQLEKRDSVTPESVLELTNTVTNAINNGSATRIYAGDLTVAAETVHTVGYLVGKSESTDSDLRDIMHGYGTAVGHIINPKASAIWRFSEVGYLENRITSLLGSMEIFSTNVAKRTSHLLTHGSKRSVEATGRQSGEFNVSLEHLGFSVRVLDRTYNFSSIATNKGRKNATLSLPSDIFTRAIQGTSDPYIHMYSAEFPSVSTLLEETNTKITAPSPVHNITAFLNSEIISSKILNVPSQTFQNLEHPVVLTFAVQDSTLPRILKRSCVFMNMSSTNMKDQWMTEGCSMDEERSNMTHTVCVCNHLTNFAVLMDVYGIEDTIDDFNSDMLTYFSYVGGGLSILGCAISIIIFEFFRLKNERIRVHEQLAATIVLVQLFFLIGIDRTENRHVCKAVAICLHYFLLSMFSWMLVEGTHLYLALVKVFKSHSHMKKYVAIGWDDSKEMSQDRIRWMIPKRYHKTELDGGISNCVPLVIVGISAGIFHDYYGSGSVCWLPRKVLLVAFIPPVGLVVIINTVVLLIVMRIMLKSMSRGSKNVVDDRSSIRIGLKAAAVLLPLLGLTWTFGFLSITSKETLIFTYLFTFFNSMQGVFFFVFHCLLSVDVQNAYERRSRRRSQMRLTESSSSRGIKRGSEFDSSTYNFSKTSVKTAFTEASSTLDRRRLNRDRTYSGSSRPQSVTFDDDVFLTPQNNDSVSSRTSNLVRHNGMHPSLHNQSSIYSNSMDSTRYDATRTNSLNNIERIGSKGSTRSNEGYVLYYGNDGSRRFDHEDFPIIDKNQLYATVQKGL